MNRELFPNLDKYCLFESDNVVGQYWIKADQAMNVELLVSIFSVTK